MATKYIVVTGGVVSGLGKGITAAALGRLLKARGLRVTAQKLDPYINVDPGTMNPLQHGEVFVTDDGAETDLDLGHYERFLDEPLCKYANLTSGKIYWEVLREERAGAYLGETVQVIPHITGKIKSCIYKNARETHADCNIIEIGGTVGDMESLPFLEAARQLSREVGRENFLLIHVTLVPFLAGSGEHKSKPTQHSVKELQGLGLQPDVIVTRSDSPIPASVLDKIAQFCSVEREAVIENRTLDCLYEAPLMLAEQGLDKVVCSRLGLESSKADMGQWSDMVSRMKHRSGTVTMALVGKYIQLQDAYLSVVEALEHAGADNGVQVQIRWIDSETLTPDNVQTILGAVDGLLIPGGFGTRGIEGKITACQFAREHGIPFFGICLGMQTAVMEYARHVCALEAASSKEFTPDGRENVIDFLPGQQDTDDKGGTMRLGAYPCVLTEGSVMYAAYGKSTISERHRHRYEVSSAFIPALTAEGLVFSGKSPDGTLMEAMEIPTHHFYVGVQFHPELQSRPNAPHPLFCAFVKAMKARAAQISQEA